MLATDGCEVLGGPTLGLGPAFAPVSTVPSTPALFIATDISSLVNPFFLKNSICRDNGDVFTLGDRKNFIADCTMSSRSLGLASVLGGAVAGSLLLFPLLLAVVAVFVLAAPLTLSDSLLEDDVTPDVDDDGDDDEGPNVDELLLLPMLDR